MIRTSNICTEDSNQLSCSAPSCKNNWVNNWHMFYVPFCMHFSENKIICSKPTTTEYYYLIVINDWLKKLALVFDNKNN